MAIYHVHIRSVQRSKGQSVVAYAAYISASKLVQRVCDLKTGIASEIIHDYRLKQGVVFSQIFTPGEVPSWVHEREAFWNYYASLGKRKDSEEAKKFDIALPKELTLEQNIELAKEIVEKVFVIRGLIVDANIHYDNENNPHFHGAFTTRQIIYSDKHEIVFGKKIVELDHRSKVCLQREEIAIQINEHLEMHGHDSRVSHLSHRDRGIELQPGIHIGVAGSRMSVHERRVMNEEIALSNAHRIISKPELVIDKLSIDKPVFTARDIEKVLRDVLTKTFYEIPNNNGDNAEINKSAIDKKIVELLPIVLSSGKLTLVNPCDLRGNTLYGLSNRIDLEKRFENTVEHLRQDKTNSIDAPNFAKVMLRENKSGFEFSEQQKEAITQIFVGSNIVALEGLPGAGKSTVMPEVKRLYDFFGYKVIGTALTSKASLELGEKLYIEAINTTRLRQLWQKEKGYESPLNLRYDYYLEDQYQNTEAVINNKTILIIDEASTIDTPVMDYFLSEASKAGAKVILLGDNNQNPAIGSKGSFAKVCEKVGSIKLTEVNRHKHSNIDIRNAHIKATKLLSEYKIADAIDLYDSLSMIHIAVDESSKRRLIVEDVVSQIIEFEKQKAENKTSLKTNSVSRIAIGAFLNEEVDYYNKEVRCGLVAAGIVEGDGIEVRSGSDKIKISIGDQIIFKSNSYGKDEHTNTVINNEIGEIIDIGAINKDGFGTFVVRLKDIDGKVKNVTIDNREQGRSIEFKHGYALTTYALQGATIEDKRFSGDKYSGYESFLVGATRHTNTCKIYFANDTLENEVYKLKSLSTEEIKEEFNAKAYEWVTDADGEKQKRDLPLWKIGLCSLINRRADLNFVDDYKYREIKNIKLEELKEKVSIARDSHADALNNVYVLEDKLSKHSDKYLEQIEKYFEIDKSEVNRTMVDKINIQVSRRLDINILSMMQSIEKYELGDLVKKTAGLKAGAVSYNKIDKFKWDELAEESRNIIVYSFLNKSEKAQVNKVLRDLKIRQEKVIGVGSDYNKELEKVKLEAIDQNKELTGNLGVIRDYLNSQKVVSELKSKKSEFDKDLKIFQKLKSNNQIKGLRQNILDLKQDIINAETNRPDYAKTIIDNYHGSTEGDNSSITVGKYLKQLGCSYQTILRHAKLDNSKVYFEQKLEKTMIDDQSFGALLSEVNKIDFGKVELSKEQNISLKSAYIEVSSNIEQIKEELHNFQNEIKNLESKRDGLTNDYSKAKFFEEQTFPYYLSRVYKHEDTKQVILKLNTLMEEYKPENYDKLVSDIVRNPQMLGEYNTPTKQVTSWWRSLFMLKPSQIEQISFVQKNLRSLEPNLNIYVSDVLNKERINDQIKQTQEQLRNILDQKTSLVMSMPNMEEKALVNAIGKSLEENKTSELKEFLQTNSKFTQLIKQEQKQNHEENIKQTKNLSQSASMNVDHKYEKHELNALRFQYAKDKQAEELIEIKQIANSNAESLFCKYFDNRNYKLSNKQILRFGNKGSVVCHISGKNIGMWHDFEQGSGGSIIDLIKEKHSTDFKGAIEQLKSDIGYISKQDSYKQDIELNRKQTAEIFRKYEEKHLNNNDILEQEKKVEKANKIFDKSEIVLSKTVGSKYLKTRGIEESVIDTDLRTTKIFIKELNKEMPALIGFARDFTGRITGGQQIILDPDTYQKANISCNKKSFGKISSSFIEISDKQVQNKENITIIAEGIETALSIKQAGINAKILCSLGVGNIQNYIAGKEEIVIIAADNDGLNASSNKSIQIAYDRFKERTEYACIMKPNDAGDFNDILKQLGKDEASKQIQEMFCEKITEQLIKRENNNQLNNEYKINEDVIESIKDILKPGTKLEQSIYVCRKQISNMLDKVEQKTEFVEHIQLALNHAPDKIKPIINLCLDDSMGKGSSMLRTIVQESIHEKVVTAIDRQNIETILKNITPTEQRLICFDTVKNICNSRRLTMTNDTSQALSKIQYQKQEMHHEKQKEIENNLQQKINQLRLNKQQQQSHGMSMGF